MDPVTASLLAAGASAGGNIITAGINYASVQKTNKAQLELYKLQNQDNIKNWQMANEYNAPKAQMQRYAEAGLNPNLMYGNGTPGNSTSLPQNASVPTLSTYQAPQNIVGDAINSYNSVSATQRANELNEVQVLSGLLHYEIDNDTKEEAKSMIREILSGQRRQNDLLYSQQQIMHNFGLLNVQLDVEIKENALKQSKYATEQAYVLLDDLKDQVSHNKLMRPFERAQAKASLNLIFKQTLKCCTEISVLTAQREKILNEADNISKDSKLKEIDIEIAEKNKDLKLAAIAFEKSCYDTHWRQSTDVLGDILAIVGRALGIGSQTANILKTLNRTP